jgi:predicted ATPase/class 3 adenylate cyclase
LDRCCPVPSGHLGVVGSLNGRCQLESSPQHSLCNHRNTHPARVDANVAFTRTRAGDSGNIVVVVGGVSVRAFLLTDVEGSTALLERVGDRYRELLHRHQLIIREAIAAVGGVEQSTEGDSLFVTFATVSDALSAAVQAQRGLVAECWPADGVVRVRMGVHVGEMVESEAGLVGLAINHGARIAASAHGGQIVVSDAVRVLAGTLPDGVGLVRLGRFGLRDVGVVTLFQVTHRDLQQVFPQPRSVIRAFGNVTASLSSLVGRDVEVGVVTAMVGSGRLVTLTGAGGSGKTRLAVEVAAGLVDSYEDGVWLVELAPLSDPASVGSVVASVLGVKIDANRAVVECLVETLADREMLLVLDNCEHLLDVVAWLAERLVRSCPRLVVLATSREPLGVSGEGVFRVPSLSFPDIDSELEAIVEFESVRLFVERARDHDAGFQVDDAGVVLIGAICRRLDGMPLAIELAAARTRSMSITDLHARLDDRFRLLTGGSRTALPRQQTLRALIDWSYDALTASEQIVLDRLSVFAGGFELASAQAALTTTTTMDGWEAVEVIGLLVDKNLIHTDTTPSGSRYRLLETVRQYAAERLADRGDDIARAARRAHCEVFVELAETAKPELHGPDQRQWLHRLEADVDNLRTALMYSVDDPDGTEHGVRLAVALRQFFWRTTKLHDELIDTLTRLVDVPILPAPVRADALYVLSNLTMSTSMREAQGYADAGLALARQLGDTRRTVIHLVSSAFIAICRGDARTALDYSDEALNLATDGDDRYTVWWAHYTRGSALKELGNLEAAHQACVDTLENSRSAGDHFSQSAAFRELGNVELAAGRYSQVRQFFEESVSAWEASGAARNVQIPLDLGFADFALGNHDSARRLFHEALEIERVTGDMSGFPYSLLAAALSATQLGKFDAAAQLHSAADHHYSEAGATPERFLEQLLQQGLANLHEHLQPLEFDLAYQHGQRLTRSQALELALDTLTN